MRYKIIGFWVVLAIFYAMPAALAVPEFLTKPDQVQVKGPKVAVVVHTEPFKLEITGDAQLEQLDENRIRLKSKSGNLAISLAPGEAIYGLTERLVSDRKTSETFVRAKGGLDRRGEIVHMWIKPTLSVYAPFYISSAGYGMYVEGTWPGVYDIGNTDKNVMKVGWETGPEGFSCVFIKGPKFIEVLDRYTAMTGRPILPPKWVFLPWKWRDACSEDEFADLDGVSINAEVADDIKNYEQLGFPVGVYMIDRPWADGTFGYGNYNWDPDRFPSGDDMVRVLHDRGWRVVIWGAPWAIGEESWEFGPEARQKGLIIGDRNLDYTNPAAVAWHREKIEEFLKRTKIDGWKLDRGEEYNPSGKNDTYFDGRSGFEVHNDYPRMYIKTYHDATRAVRGDDFVLKARPGYTGTTAWSVVWGGDIAGSLFGVVSTSNGLRSAIIALQRSAFMGYPVWGSDTGGYVGFKNREVFARWLEFSALCPLMEIGGVGSHEPWAMPTKPSYDDEMIKIFRRYTWLHTRLVDYTYKLAQRAHETGNPIVHSLVMDWPDDPAVKDMWDEYMYGPALLVAPVWEVGVRERKVYLPEGEWLDFWDRSKSHQGPATITAPVPLDRILIFIKSSEKNLLPKGISKGL